MASVSATHRNPLIKAFYDRLRAAGKAHEGGALRRGAQAPASGAGRRAHGEGVRPVPDAPARQGRISQNRKRRDEAVGEDEAADGKPMGPPAVFACRPLFRRSRNRGSRGGLPLVGRSPPSGLAPTICPLTPNTGSLVAIHGVIVG